MELNNNLINDFSSQIDSASSHEDLKKVLHKGWKISQEFSKTVHFWQFEDKGLLARLKKAYNRGIQKLIRLSHPLKKEPFTLLDKVASKTPLPAKVKEAVSLVGAGLGGLAGAFVGYAYEASLSRISSELSGEPAFHPSHGPMGLPQKPSDPAVIPSTPLQNESLVHDIPTFAANVELNLSVATALAGLELLVARKDKRALAGVLLGTSTMGIIAASSYLHLYPEVSTWAVPTPTDGVPPGLSGELISFIIKVTNCSAIEASYIASAVCQLSPALFIPFVLFGALAPLFVKDPVDIADECVLLHLLTENTDSLELKTLMAEVEVEMKDEYETFPLLPTEKKQEFVGALSNRLLTKIQLNTKAKTLFNKTRSTLAKKIKGKFHTYTSFTFRLRALASLVAFMAYQLLQTGKVFLSFGQKAVSILATLFNYLVGIFASAQGLCALIDCIKAYLDVCNEKLSSTFKILSVSQANLSIFTFSMVLIGLLASPLIGGIIPFILIGATLFKIGLFLGQQYEMRQRQGAT